MQCRALIVEDDPACAEDLGELLADAGHKSAWAADPAQALSAIGKDPRIGVILLDLHLPEMDGLRLLVQLRDAPRKRGASLQSILCSAGAVLDDLASAM